MSSPVSIEPVPLEAKPVLARLLQLYLYDFTEFEPRELEESGAYPYRYLDEYWAPAEGESRHAFFIRDGAALAGFAMVRVVNGVNVMSEFFVLRGHRRAGVGGAAAQLVFEALPGRWLVHEVATNLPAQAFWHRTIAEVTGAAYSEDSDDGLTQRFETG